MSYSVKEIFYTLQGEGANSGRPAVFCRFTGCNLWSGREQHRANAQCTFCDTDFVGVDGEGGGRFADAEQLAAAVAAHWPGGGQPLVVCTGGEPLLQLDVVLIDAFHRLGLEVAVETNGTLPVPPGIDWLCVSPKAGTHLHQQSGDELKLVWPQAGLDPSQYEGLAFQHFYLQAMDGPQQQQNLKLVVGFCLNHPRWRVSLQTHKLLNIP